MKRILLTNVTVLLILIVLFSIVILSLIYTDLKYNIVNRSNPEGTKEYQVWVDGMLSHQKKQYIIKKLDRKDCVRLHFDHDAVDDEVEEKDCEVITFDASKHFDVNSYFTVLKNITMEKGYVLNYHYNDDDANAKPYLYARKIESAPAPMQLPDKAFADNLRAHYKSPDAKSPAKDEYVVAEIKKFYVNRYSKHIVADGSPESFLQLVILTVMGEHFYLKWHANYYDHAVICHKSGLKDTIPSPFVPGESISLPDEFYAAAQSIDFTPYIKFQNTVVIVSVVTFTKWGGFERWEFRINRGFPHEILDMRVKTILSYEWGFKF